MKDTNNKENNEKKPETGNVKDSQTSTEKPQADDSENSTTYKKDPKTGKWIIQNPAGSMVYNYLYRDSDEW